MGWCVGGREESLFYTGANEPCCGKKTKKHKCTRRGSGVCQRRYKHNLAGNHLHSHRETCTYTHVGGGGVHPGCTHPSLHRKPLHADTALRDAAAMHYSPFLNTDSPVFTAFYTVCVIRGASEGKQKWQARRMDEHDACKK